MTSKIGGAYLLCLAEDPELRLDPLFPGTNTGRRPNQDPPQEHCKDVEGNQEGSLDDLEKCVQSEPKRSSGPPESREPWELRLEEFDPWFLLGELAHEFRLQLEPKMGQPQPCHRYQPK